MKGTHGNLGESGYLARIVLSKQGLFDCKGGQVGAKQQLPEVCVEQGDLLQRRWKIVGIIKANYLNGEVVQG